MYRRSFVKLLGTAGVGASVGNLGFRQKKPSHLLTLSFDDGFKKSFLKTADIYEQYRLSACFNVIASGHFPGYVSSSDAINAHELGDFTTWNALVERGHEVMPHGWEHANLAELPLDEAKKRIDQCVDYFTEHLKGFDPRRAVFNFPYNSSTPEVEDYILTKVGAFRTVGNPVNPLPSTGLRKLYCASMGPGNIDDWLEATLNEFLQSPSGWMIINTHGLDEEGWGPMTSQYLDNLLRRLVKIEHLEMLPTAKALQKYA